MQLFVPAPACPGAAIASRPSVPARVPGRSRAAARNAPAGRPPPAAGLESSHGGPRKVVAVAGCCPGGEPPDPPGWRPRGPVRAKRKIPSATGRWFAGLHPPGVLPAGTRRPWNARSASGGGPRAGQGICRGGRPGPRPGRPANPSRQPGPAGETPRETQITIAILAC